MSTQIVILAAGQGKRMNSTVPKILHLLAGKPLLARVVETAKAILSETQKPIVIYGHQGEVVQAAMQSYAIQWVHQSEQRGTGHAVQQALPFFQDDDHVLILYGDTPLISVELLTSLITSTPTDALGMLVAELTNPTGYGRIKRDAHGRVICIIEEKDATVEEKKIKEINPGIYWLPARYLKAWLPTLTNHNQQKEYYLTDLIELAVAHQVPIHTIKPAFVEEILGINDCVQLAFMERFYQQQKANQLLKQGVTLADPARFDVRGDVQVGQDVMIDINVILEGKVIIGNHVKIGPQVILRNTIIGDYVDIQANSLIDGAEIGAHSQIGPFARLRPGTVLSEEVHIGNFVEVKNSRLGDKTKANHLSYLGDSEIGCRVNVGAGTITCNYDGANKHKTYIGDDVHIGSDTQLVAPVRVEAGATLAAGSTVVKNVPANQLTLTHDLHQRTVSHWQRPVKLKKE